MNEKGMKKITKCDVPITNNDAVEMTTAKTRHTYGIENNIDAKSHIHDATVHLGLNFGIR